MNSFVRFLEESSARKKTFRDYLTFKDNKNTSLFFHYWDSFWRNEWRFVFEVVKNLCLNSFWFQQVKSDESAIFHSVQSMNKIFTWLNVDWITIFINPRYFTIVKTKYVAKTCDFSLVLIFLDCEFLLFSNRMCRSWIFVRRQKLVVKKHIKKS